MLASLTIMRKALELMERGQAFALCTVAVARGSVPGRPGAKMIVFANREQIGTVGGAGLEENVKSLAVKCLSEGSGGIFHFDLSRQRPGGLDSLCGGSLDVVIEVMSSRPHVLLAGGGHVALEVARLCDQLEYGFSVVDGRPEFSARERFVTARELYALEPPDFFATTDLTTFTHVLILGHSHAIDLEALARLLPRFRGFIGVIASRAKQKELFKQLRERGFGDADLKRVEAPVGLPIGSETPAEIAVSIMGSVIAHYKQIKKDK
jgi:xanthine dehydrogenase accessory factor